MYQTMMSPTSAVVVAVVKTPVPLLTLPSSAAPSPCIRNRHNQGSDGMPILSASVTPWPVSDKASRVTLNQGLKTTSLNGKNRAALSPEPAPVGSLVSPVLVLM